MQERIILAGDIGGTKTNLAMVSTDTPHDGFICEAGYGSRDFASFEEMVRSFLKKHNVRPIAACFGVAGPVLAGSVKITKLSWHLIESRLQEDLNIPKVTLINDLAATAHALPVLPDADFICINRGEEIPHANKIIVAPGTGLGETFLTWRQGKYDVFPSEGGHALFAPATPLQTRMLMFLQELQCPITYDLICSGQGIPLIYDFLNFQKHAHEPDWLAEKLRAAGDRAVVIVEAAGHKDEAYSAAIAGKTVDVFVEILASECANFALKVLAAGGIYLAGGIPPRIVDFINNGKFMQFFTGRPPFNEYLNKIPVHLITNPKAALIGAANYGLAFF